MKRIWRFLSSMQFAILLLILLAVACSLCSIIPQGQSYQWYSLQYSERKAAFIIALHLDDAYHSWWFITIAGFLCINLIACNLIRLPQLIRKTNRFLSYDVTENLSYTCHSEGLLSAEPIFQYLHMPVLKHFQNHDGYSALASSKNWLGLWGAWICHLGILLLILGFSLDQIYRQEWIVYGVPGQSREIGDTGYVLSIDDFKIDLRNDDTVEQYSSYITVRNLLNPSQKDMQEAVLRVNEPANLFGMKFYQNSTGWAARIIAKKEESVLNDEVVCAGDGIQISGIPDLVVYLTAFYPDYVQVPGSGPETASGQLNNPAYLYSVYYQNRMIGMNILMPEETITIDDISVRFSDPEPYTLIQIKKDPFTAVAFIGGILTTIGLIFAFYMLPVRLYAFETEANGWTVCAACEKGGSLFREQFNEIIKKASVNIERSNHASN